MNLIQSFQISLNLCFIKDLVSSMKIFPEIIASFRGVSDYEFTTTENLGLAVE
jgi:hypothetical protein